MPVKGGSGKAGLWVALLVGGLAVAAVAYWFLGSGKFSREATSVPAATEQQTAPASSPSAPSAEAPAPSPEPSAPVETKDAAKHGSTPSVAPKSAKAAPAAPAAPAAVPAPAKPAPVEEDHAPVKVFVTSRPSGASVAFEGKTVGTTPCEVVLRKSGSLDFSLAGYRTLHRAVDPDEVHGSISVQLLSDGGGGATGRIYIESAPQGAEILVGGKSMGRTPRMVELPVGSQKVTVKSGVQSQTRTLDIQSGQNPSERFSL